MAVSLINQQRRKMYTDIQLQCRNITIECHACVLATKSMYFADVFNRSTESSEIDLNGLRHPDSLTKVVDFIYTGDIVIEEYCVADILHVSNILLIDDLKPICEGFINNAINSDNCIEYFFLAYDCGLEEVLPKAKGLIYDNFESFMEKEQALDISYVHLKDLIRNRDVKNNFPDALLDFCFKWMTHKGDQSEGCIFNILSSINLYLCDQFHLLTVHKANSELFDVKSANLILDVIHRQSLDKDASRQREVSRKLIVIGGVVKINEEYHINDKCFTSAPGEELTEYYHLPKGWCYRGSSICQFDDKSLIISGGQSRDGISQKSCKLFQIHDKKIDDMPSLNVSRHGHQSIKVSEKIYIIGGLDNKYNMLDSVECLEESIWKYKRQMIHAIRHPKITSIDKDIYVLGQTLVETVAQCYNIITNQWSLIEAPTSDIFDTLVVSDADSIYVCGGYNRICAKYTQNNWSQMKKPPKVQGWPSGTVQDGVIFMYGGWNSDDNPTDVIECYNPLSNEWNSMNMKLPIKLVEHNTFMVSI